MHGKLSEGDPEFELQSQ